MEKFTWKDLKKAANKMTDKQLSMQVVILIDDESAKVDELYIMPEAVYVNINNDEDCASLEELQEIHGDEFNIKDYTISTRKGTPFLATSTD